MIKDAYSSARSFNLDNLFADALNIISWLFPKSKVTKLSYAKFNNSIYIDKLL